MAEAAAVHYWQDAELPIEAILCMDSTIRYPLHNHVSVGTAGIVLNGAAMVSISGNTRVLRCGQSFAVPPYVPHCITAAERYSLLTVCVDKQAPARYGMQALRERLARLLRDEQLGANRLNAQQTGLLINAVLYALCSDGFAWDRSPEPYLALLRQQLERVPELPLSVDAMARAAFLSKYHFIRRFQQSIGLTPHRFQLQNRIRKAQRLLRQAESLTEVALTAGFFDQSHFTREFKKQVGLTPSEYRKSCGTIAPEGASSGQCRDEFGE